MNESAMHRASVDCSLWQTRNLKRKAAREHDALLPRDADVGVPDFVGHRPGGRASQVAAVPLVSLPLADDEPAVVRIEDGASGRALQRTIVAALCS